MPTKPMLPCAYPTCPELSHNRYCDKHAHLQQSSLRTHTPEQRAFYNSGFWKKLRMRVRYEEPLCRLCLNDGRVSPTALIDHIDGDYNHNARENLQGICRACDAKKSARQHRAKRGGGDQISGADHFSTGGVPSRERPHVVKV